MAKKTIDNDELTTYYKNIYGAIENKTIEDPYGNYVLQRIKGGQKKVFNKTQTEIRNFDMSFLDTIESVYPAILKIMRDPKKSIRYDEEIVSVEKAKKVNSQTVRHLSSHTQLIKEITDEGDVIPSKVLTTFAEEELAIYENRFIKSLVKRIEMFLERRYEVMKVSLESFESQKLNVSNEFLLSGQKVTVNLDIEVKNDLTTNVETTKEQYNRLLYIREMIQGLKGSEFMRALAKAREVLPPIMKTNIIMHNPDFKLCYGLWLYLDKVDGISTNIDIKEKNYRYSNIFERDINQCMTLALTSFLKNREIEGVYSSKNLPSIKAPKIQNNEDIELELNLNADTKKLEDYTMNQILLDETAKFFEASMNGFQRTGNTYNESIRVVYRQMLDMLDQIYPRAFGVSDDELESKDLYEQLEYARRRMMILKIVRQQKQMNIARMGKEEKRIEKLTSSLERKIQVQEEKERIRLEKQREKEEAQRLAAIEKEKALEEKRKRLAEAALAKQKENERKALAKKEKKEANKQKGKELALKRREHLKNLKKGNKEDEAEKLEVENENQAVLDEKKNIEENLNPEIKDATNEHQEEEIFDDNSVEEANDEENNEPEEVLYVDEEGNPIESLNNEESEEQIVEEEKAEDAEEVQEENEELEEQIAEEMDPEDAEETQEENEESEEQIAEDTHEDDVEEPEEVMYVDEDGNPIEESSDDEDGEPEEVIYVDEEGNPIESYEESTDEQDAAADEYEQMLKESGMTDEEIAELLKENK